MTEPLSMLTLLQEQSCCGKVCTNCPYHSKQGKPNSKGSVFLNKKKIAAHVRQLIAQNKPAEAKQILRYVSLASGLRLE